MEFGGGRAGVSSLVIGFNSEKRPRRHCSIASCIPSPPPRVHVHRNTSRFPQNKMHWQVASLKLFFF